MEIDIGTLDKKNYYYYRLKLFSPFKPFSILTEKERRLFALILSSYDENKDSKSQDLFVFSHENKKRILEEMNVSKASFDNSMSALRKKGFTKYRSLEDKYRGLLKITNKITFKFKVQ
jgi:hypothetical protein